MPNINIDALNSIFKVFGGICIPPEGPVAIPVILNFSTTVAEYVAELTLTEQNRKVSYIQGLYVDNSGNAAALDIYIQNSQQLVTVPPGYQGYVQLLVPNPPVIEFGSVVSSDTVVVVQLLNFPVSNILWNTDPTHSNAPLVVTDPTLDALLVNGYLPVLMQGIASQAITSQPIADSRVSIDVTNASNNVLIAAPGAGVRIWLESIALTLSADATLAAAGALSMDVREGASGSNYILRNSVYVPNAAITTPGNLWQREYYPRRLLPDNTAVGVVNSVALTAGALRVQASYTLVTT